MQFKPLPAEDMKLDAYSDHQYVVIEPKDSEFFPPASDVKQTKEPVEEARPAQANRDESKGNEEEQKLLDHHITEIPVLGQDDNTMYEVIKSPQVPNEETPNATDRLAEDRLDAADRIQDFELNDRQETEEDKAEALHTFEASESDPVMTAPHEIQPSSNQERDAPAAADNYGNEENENLQRKESLEEFQPKVQNEEFEPEESDEGSFRFGTSRSVEVVTQLTAPVGQPKHENHEVHKTEEDKRDIDFEEGHRRLGNNGSYGRSEGDHDRIEDDDADSNQSFGREVPIKHITVTNQDQDIIDFKHAFDLKYSAFKRSILEKYEKIRFEYLKQMDLSIRENERNNQSTIMYLEQQLEDAMLENETAKARATQSRIILANVLREKYNTFYMKRAVFQAWKYYYDWKNYEEAKSKF